MFTYGHIEAEAGVLLGIITMRDMLLHEKVERLENFMLRADLPLQDAMRLTLDKHFYSYPVCDESGHLLGIARGARMFQQETIELCAQPGRMVGVESEECVTSTFARSLRFRHSWL